MTNNKVAYILGSSRKKKNTYAFAKSLMHSFEKRNFESTVLYSIDNYNRLTETFISTIKESETICILCPLYADFIPFHLVKVLELLESQKDLSLKGKKLFGFSQCAFPFYRLNECSISSMAFFVRHTAMHWTGGLMYGGAGMMDCESLDELGKKGQKMILAMDLAAEGIIQSGKVPSQSQELLQMNIPSFLKRPVMWFINRNVKKIEKEVGKPIDAQAYRERGF